MSIKSDRHIVAFYNQAVGGIRKPNSKDCLSLLHGEWIPDDFLTAAVTTISHYRQFATAAREKKADLCRQLNGINDDTDETKKETPAPAYVVIGEDFWREDKEYAMSDLCKVVLDAAFFESAEDAQKSDHDIQPLTLFTKNVQTGLLEPDAETAYLIRLGILTMLFDYEATAREANYLGKLLDNSRKNPPDELDFGIE